MSAKAAPRQPAQTADDVLDRVLDALSRDRSKVVRQWAAALRNHGQRAAGPTGDKSNTTSD